MKQILSRFHRTSGGRLRFIVQTAALAYILFIGVRFVYYIAQLKRFNFDVSKPYGVEGFLPISALLGFKQLVMTGAYDKVHAAGLTIFLAIVAVSFLFKKSFCSHICPVGFVSEQVTKVGKRWRIPVYIPIWFIKYFLLAFFVYIVVTMPVQAVRSFIFSPYNVVSDYKMLALFMPPSLTTVIVITVLLLLTLLFRNFWCKNLCPYGALLGVISVFSPLKVKRDVNLCINCLKCSDICPASLRVHKQRVIHDPDCIGCHDCINVCPVEGCLATTALSYKRHFPLLIVGFYMLYVGISMLGGLWESVVTNRDYWMIMMRGVGHP